MGATHSHVCRAHSLFCEASDHFPLLSVTLVSRATIRAFEAICERRSSHLPTSRPSVAFRKHLPLGRRGDYTTRRSFDQVQRLRVRTKALQHDYEIKISRGILDNIGEEARACLGGHARRIAVISNQKVFDIYGRRTIRSLDASDFLVCRLLIGDGERFKFLRTAEQT